MSLRIGDKARDFTADSTQGGAVHAVCATAKRGRGRVMTKGFAISLGLLASACATGASYAETARPHRYELVSLEREVSVRAAPERRCPSEPTRSAALTLFERLYPVHPLTPVHGVHEEPLTP